MAVEQVAAAEDAGAAAPASLQSLTDCHFFYSARGCANGARCEFRHWCVRAPCSALRLAGWLAGAGWRRLARVGLPPRRTRGGGCPRVSTLTPLCAPFPARRRSTTSACAASGCRARVPTGRSASSGTRRCAAAPPLRRPRGWGLRMPRRGAGAAARRRAASSRRATAPRGCTAPFRTARRRRRLRRRPRPQRRRRRACAAPPRRHRCRLARSPRTR